MSDLWLEDVHGPIPSCAPCQNDVHTNCADLILVTHPEGEQVLVSCGCEDCENAELLGGDVA